MRRAADRHLAGQRGGARVLRQLDQPEVEHLGDVRLAAPDRDEHVGGLQVPVDQAQRVGLGQPRADLAEQVDHPPGRQRAGPAHQLGEAQALEVLHHVVERPVVGVAVVVDLDRVGVRQPGGRLHLALEPGQGDRVGPGLGLDQLQGAGALQELVLGEVDLAHPALAQLAHELVLAELAGLGAARCAGR